MTETIIPLRPRGGGRSLFARIDPIAADLLAEGQVASLQAARIEVMLTDLRVQRERFAKMIAELRGQESTGYAEIDEANAELITAINRGITQLDLFIARTRVLVNTPARAEPRGPCTLG